MPEADQTGARERAGVGCGSMLRVTTLYASSATATAAYYAQYLTAAPGEAPGVWSGRQAAGLGLFGTVGVDELEQLLTGRDPATGLPLGRELLDRFTSDGRVIKAVSGFDATFSAPKSLSVWWALTGDHRLLDAHDVAVSAALAHLERFGSTTRIRSDGGRLHPDTSGLTMATFRQTTSRSDDPQIHTHAVVSAKVQTEEGRWFALDARYLKRHQRMLGGLYQSLLRAELTHRFGVDWRPIVRGQAEIAGMPDELIAVFSKRSVDIDAALADKLDDFRHRHGREPSRWERAAMSREAAADTRSRKSGHGAADLATRWQREAAEVGWTVARFDDSIQDAARNQTQATVMTVNEVVETVSAQRSSWGRADVIQAICDVQRPVAELVGHRWADAVERSADRVIGQMVDLDPTAATLRRASDGRSVWIEPTAPRFTSEMVLAQEEAIVAWAMEAQMDPPAPSTTVDQTSLDVLQGDAAAAVAGHNALVLVVGPAGAGKTRMLAAAVDDLHWHGRPSFGLAPTARAARTLERDTGLASDTVAKLLYEWDRPDRPAGDRWRLPVAATVIVDEAGMIGTPALYRLVGLAHQQGWRLALVGDHRQLQAVGRGGLFHELVTSTRVEMLEEIHRFSAPWEAAASLRLRAGDLRGLDAYEANGRIIAGTLDDHLTRIAGAWIERHDAGETTAMVASSNDHVDAINAAVQTARLAGGHLDPDRFVVITGAERVYVGDVIATRRNDRRLVTTCGERVRNRETWTVTAIHDDGALTVIHEHGRGTVTLPVDYVHDHVRLGYAATEHGYQSATVTAAIELASTATTRRGVYVGVTRGRDENLICVNTESNDVAEARDVLDAILSVDRADVPAVTQRRTLAAQARPAARPESPVSPPGRCQVPEWLAGLLADARQALAAAEHTAESHAAERARRAAAVTAAEGDLADVDRATAPHRRMLAVDEKRADGASRDYAAAQRRLADSGRRGRRAARRELDIAEQVLDRATAIAQRTRRRAALDVEHYRVAVTNVDKTRTDLRHHDLATQLDAWSRRLPDLAYTVTALDTWQRWANGDTISVQQLRDTAEILTDAHRTDHDEQYRVLGNALQAWAGTAGIDLHMTDPQPSALRRMGIELGL
ncbi:MAG: relaxase domain-containing protein [Acidimicrobiia bacterium]|nr:relaxase domain-containing protein [Acidimicrobiia bacterium]